MRGFSDVVYVGGFYGQPEFGRTDLSRISVDALASLLRSLKPGISEVSCHPGYLRARQDAVRLINYRDYARLVGTK